jgi:putative redox protein
MDNKQKVTVKLHNGRFRLISQAKADDLNPKALLLCSAAQCTGYTVMSILHKDHISPKSFEITVEGTLNTPTLQPSSEYQSFKVEYNIECRNMGDQNIVSEAVLESQNEKCGVIAMLRKIAPVSHEISVVSTESACL